MSLLHLTITFSMCYVSVLCQEDCILNTLEYKELPSTSTETDNKIIQSKVTAKFYYESLCPYCRESYLQDLVPTVQKLQPYMGDFDIYTNPYGNAKTLIDANGKITFKCQHGPNECYGNMLHACALDSLNITSAIYYNACLMDKSRTNKGSDDAAADVCGKQLGINPEPIKQCAKGERGTTLLKHHGEESKKAGFYYVPYELINGKETTNFWKDLCAAFTNPPPPCKDKLTQSQ